MTANASPKGRPPLQLPSPPRKPMPAGHRKRRGWSCMGLSCFGGSPVANSDAGHPLARGRRAPWFTGSGFRKKKKTVPVDSSATELIPAKIVPGGDRRLQAAAEEDEAAGKDEHGAKEEEQGKQHRLQTAPTKALAAAVELPSQSSFLRRLWKGNKDGGGFKAQSSGSNNDQVRAFDQKPQQQQPWQQHRLPSISPKYDARRRSPQPPPPPKPAQTVPSRPYAAPTSAARRSPSTSSATASPGPAKPPPNHAGTTSRHGGARAHRKGEETSSFSSSVLPAGRNDQMLGLSVMVVVLVMMVLFGRVSAIVFTCLWFYCLPRLRATMAEANGGGGKSSAAIDFDWEEYKKRVVLEGLLQRDGRRPPGFSS